MRILLHIGQSKTGTSALQHFLAKNRKLLEIQGILYPDISQNRVPVHLINHNSFANALTNYIYYPWLSAEEYAEHFIRQYEDGRFTTLLLSGESFFGGDPNIFDIQDEQEFLSIYEKKLLRLASLFPDAAIEIVLYLRRQDLWFESAIGQIIRYEGTASRNVYENDEQLMELLSCRMDYFNLVTLWDQIVSPNKWNIREYAPRALVKGNIVADFLHQTRIESKSMNFNIPQEARNQSWSKEFIEIKKALNRIPKSKARERAVIETISKINAQRGSGEKYIIAPELRKVIQQKTLKSNQSLCKEYVHGAPILQYSEAFSEQRPLTQQIDADEVLNDFLVTYRSFKFQCLVFKVFVQSFVRQHLPLIYLPLKQMYKKFLVV